MGAGDALSGSTLRCVDKVAMHACEQRIGFVADKTDSDSGWLETLLALLLLGGLLTVIIRVLRDFHRQGLAVSKGEANTLADIEEEDDLIDDHTD